MAVKIKRQLAFLEDNEYRRVLSSLEKYAKFISKPNHKIDQFIATRETVALRAALLSAFGDLSEKRILFLGDDDLTSIAVSFYRALRYVAVADIDGRILGNIRQIAAKENFKIDTFLYDVIHPFPKRYLDNFDVVFTDPPYTPGGVSLFLSRAIDALDPMNENARVYLCFGSSDRAKERFLPINKIIHDSGLMTRYVFDKFNEYRGVPSIGNASSLYVLESTPKTKPLVLGIYEGKIYTRL